MENNILKHKPILKIGKIEVENALILAPMEGVTDLPFRIICRRLGADIVFTEFIASEALIRDSTKSFAKLKVEDEERPVGIQIFGSNISSMVQSAKIVEDSGADFLDINFGCWVKKVVNHNAGAAFLKEPEKMVDMVSAVVDSVSIPVTVKTRLGWDRNDIIIERVVSMLTQTGISAITIHCRTRDMGMKGIADWSWIDKVKRLTSLPVILNGDVISPQGALQAFNDTECDGIMIGRAAVGNPFLFRDIKNYFATGAYNNVASIDERIDTCIEHLSLTLEYKGFRRGMFEFRKHYSGYLKGLYNASEIRQKLVLLEDIDEIRDVLYRYKDYLEAMNNK